MAKPRLSLGSVLLNLGIAATGLLLLVLVYALAVRAFAPRTDPDRPANPAGLQGDIIQVEVLNGSGVPGAAATATAYLRRRGFDVVGVGNWTSTEEPRSFALDRVGNPTAAARVLAALGLPAERAVDEPDPDSYLDVTLVLGRDLDTLPPFADS